MMMARSLIVLLLLGIFSADAAAAPPRRRAPARRVPRVDLDLKGADIHNVLRLFARIGRINIVVADGVRGRVTATLRRVPWDRALRAILAVKGLGMVRSGNIVRVDGRARLAAERKALVATRRDCRRHGPLSTRFIQPAHARAADLARLIRPTLSERGKVIVDERTNTLIVRDVICY